MSTIVLKPRISEKSYALSKQGTYVFEVAKDTNRTQVAEAVAKQFSVEVVGVRTAIIKGKMKRSARRRKQPIEGFRRDVKKAYVTLKAGDSIALFEEGQEA